MRGGWEGHFYDGETAQRHDAVVQIEPRGLVVRLGDGSIFRRPYSEMRQAPASVSGQPVRIEFSGETPQILIVADQRFIDTVREIAPSAPFRPERGDPRRPILLGLLLAGVAAFGAAAAAIYLWVLPALAGIAAERVPVDLEEKLGKIVLESITKEAGLCSSPSQNAALQSLAERLAGALPDRKYDFNITVIDDPEVNAFAAPGGYIAIHRGLLEASEAPEEVAGVLAHEMQHVVQRHVTRSLLRELALWVVLTTVTGDANTLLVQAGRAAGGLSYRRQDEEAADRGGMELVQAARLDPAGMISIYRKLADSEADLPGGLKYLSTHPAMDERVAALERMAEAADYTPVKLEAEAGWAAIAGSCRAGD